MPINSMLRVKKILLFAVIVFLSNHLRAQARIPLDSIQLKTLKGPMISYGELTRKFPVVLLCFWSVNSDHSIGELNAINKQYDGWKKSASFKLLAICVDKGNLLNRMRPEANMNGWTFDVLGDSNGDLQETLRVNNLPQSIILKKGEILYQQSGFEEGAENYLFSKIQALTAGQ